jgi:hypothetical protein
MTAETVTVDAELARQALADVLDADAAAQPAAAPPPRRLPPPDATPEAPWGFKADGTPRKGPAGPGRPRKDADAKARTDDTPDAPGKPQQPAAPAADVSYAEQVGDALTVGWMILGTIPFTKPQAAVLHNGMETLIPAWDQAARHNPTIRKYVLKLSGEGSWAWLIPVAITTMPVVMGMWQATIDQSIRPQLAKQTDADLTEFILGQAREAGLPIPDDLAGQSSSMQAA